MTRNLQLFFQKLKRLARARSLKELRRVFGLVFYDVESAWRELQLMAVGMIGQTTVIKLREPAAKNFSGHAYIDSRGVRVIDISPSVAAVGLDNFYLVVLHEIFHQIFDVKEEDKRPPIVDSMHNSEGAFFELDAAARAAYESDPREGEANDFMRQMNRIAIDHALAQFGNDEIMTRIRGLKNIRFEKENKL